MRAYSVGLEMEVEITPDELTVLNNPKRRIEGILKFREVNGNRTREIKLSIGYGKKQKYPFVVTHSPGGYFGYSTEIKVKMNTDELKCLQERGCCGERFDWCSDGKVLIYVKKER